MGPGNMHGFLAPKQSDRVGPSLGGYTLQHADTANLHPELEHAQGTTFHVLH